MTKAYYGMSLTTAEHFESDFKSLDINIPRRGPEKPY